MVPRHRHPWVCLVLGALICSMKVFARVSTTTPRPRSQGRFQMTLQSDSMVCYGELGCFSLKYPWKSLSRPFLKPASPAECDTRFYLYTRNSKRFEVAVYPKIILRGSSYNHKRPSFFIVHGFYSDGNVTWASDLKDAILSRVDGNVFVVDWGKAAKTKNYFQVASNTRIIGQELARLGRFLVKMTGARSEAFHFLGHSLGAQICSYAAKNISNVGRITGMDPAQPGFENEPKAVRLDSSDAKFVDVVHTNAKPTIPRMGFGMRQAVGHVDFYMNGGADQPGCSTPPMEPLKHIRDLFSISLRSVSHYVTCSHGRSIDYMTEAIRSTNCTMWGVRTSITSRIVNTITLGLLRSDKEEGACNKTDAKANCTPVGLDTPMYAARGTFQVVTNSHKPFCLSNDKKKAKSSPKASNG